MRLMRDVFFEGIAAAMRRDKNIYFLSADFGSASLDRVRRDFPARFINVGIAEQNLVNIASGLAMEGFTVYAYAISAFLSMRCFEQIRVNLALTGQLKKLRVNLIAVGSGVSYDVAGPTHHCLEDIALMRVLPHLELISPSDAVSARKFVSYYARRAGVRYFRLDGKALPDLYVGKPVNIPAGFSLLRSRGKVCIAATGFMTHTALKVADILRGCGIGCAVMDIFSLKTLDRAGAARALSRYQHVFSLEEGFTGSGGLDCLVRELLAVRGRLPAGSFGFDARYIFTPGTREHLHGIAGLSPQKVAGRIRRRLKQ